MNEEIGCLQNQYVDLWERLTAHYGKFLDAKVTECARRYPGGGSGGHQDRVECVMKEYESEANRIKLKK